MNILVETIGWMAALLILVAYVLVTTGRLQPRSAAYQALNVFGAAGFIVNSGWNGAIPSVALNVVWLAIGLVALTRLRREPASGAGG